MRLWLAALAVAAAAIPLLAASPVPGFAWKHLSTAICPRPTPAQTSATVADFDNDGVNDFVIAERTAPDSVVLFRRTAAGWPRYVSSLQALHVESGSAAVDMATAIWISPNSRAAESWRITEV